MINLPCNAVSMSQIAPCQNVPVQTSQYNFPTYQQRQTSTQQMQTVPCSGTSQGPFAHVYQPDTYVVTHQCAPQPITNPCHPVYQSPCSPPPSHPSCGQLPQNILDQIRACVSNTAPIFILPGNCQQSPQQQQQPTLPQATATGSLPPTTAAYPPSGLTYPAACYPPPSPFYPYPVPMPFYDSFTRARDTAQNCGCCRRRDVDPMEIRSVARAVGCRYDPELDEHHCVPTDDTICTKRSCPSSLHLQALASQFLSMQGIIACAATRLILRKVPGSNVTTTMEDTMARAQKAINVLTKDQLLSESRNAQQVNALINLHMTANPPPNIIPILTLVQLKMNLLKAQVEGLVNQKIMETQGVGVEVETDLIDPTVLALKSDAELRDFLSILRQKECDERVNVNFAPYRSQRAIAETRLSNIQNKIRQVEAEFDRRRCAMLPAPTLTSRIVQQFSRPCYSARFEDPRRLYGILPQDIPRSLDPFVCVKPRSPKRLLLKPCASKPETKSTQITAPLPATSTRGNPPKITTDAGGTSSTKERTTATTDLQQSSSMENCTCCDRTTSDESVDEAKKKLRPRIVEINASNVEKPSSLMKLTSNVCVRYEANAQKCDGKSDLEAPCDAKRWIAKAYINVADDESVRTLTGSESDTITLSEKIDAENVCESRDVIEIRSLGRIMDRQEFTSSADLRQFEKQAETEIASISRKNEAIKEYDIETRDSQGVSSPKAEQTEMKTITIAEVTDVEPISSAQETERKSPNDYTSSLEITLKPKNDRHEDEQKDKNGKILSTNETTEQSANQVPISKSKKKIRFHIVSLMTNVVYNNENCEYRSKRKIDKKIATREMSMTPDIEELDKYNSIENLRNAIAHDITGKDYSQNMFLGRLKDFSKLCVDRQCQTTSEENRTTSASLLRRNLFPPFKNLHKYMADNERNGNNVGVYPSPITKAGITTARKRLSHWNDVAKNSSETRYKDNARYPRSRVECEESFISEIFSVIANRVITFVNKVITLNGRLPYPTRGAILRKSLNIDALRRNAPIRSQPELILKDHDPLASILHCPLDSNRGTSNISKRDFRDASLLRISTGEGYGRIHKIRHSIIQDKENGTKCLLIDTSSRDCNLIRDLGRPYEVQRSLLIRSRLKDRSSTQDHPRPFSLLKRVGKDVSEEFRQAKRNENVGMIKERKTHKLRRSEKFWALSEIIKTRDKELKMREYSTEFKQILCEYSHDGITNNNVFTVQKHAIVDNIATDDELVINVHDYSELQTKINTNTYENRGVCLLLSGN